MPTTHCLFDGDAEDEHETANNDTDDNGNDSYADTLSDDDSASTR